ncbi:MAG TPA: c-type cytochrome [Longimicrobiales bacterium]
MRRTAWTTPLAVLALAGLASVACQPQDAQQQEQPPAEQPPAAQPPAAQPPTAAELPPGVTQEMVAQGQQIFTSTGLCFTCHGPDAKGMPNLGPNLTDNEWLHIDGSYDAIVNLINNGVPQPKEAASPMPPKGGSQITDEQVRAVAAYVYSLSHGGA